MMQTTLYNYCENGKKPQINKICHVKCSIDIHDRWSNMLYVVCFDVRMSMLNMFPPRFHVRSDDELHTNVMNIAMRFDDNPLRTSSLTYILRHRTNSVASCEAVQKTAFARHLHTHVAN